MFNQHNTISIHCTEFLCMSFHCTFTFLEIVHIICQKCCFFLPSSILKWLWKNSPVLFFKKYMLVWQLSQYSLTKVSQTKLKTSKCHHSHLTGKKMKEPFSQHNTSICLAWTQNSKLHYIIYPRKNGHISLLSLKICMTILWQIEEGKVEAATDFTSLGSKITADGDCNHRI